MDKNLDSRHMSDTSRQHKKSKDQSAWQSPDVNPFQLRHQTRRVDEAILDAPVPDEPPQLWPQGGSHKLFLRTLLRFPAYTIVPPAWF